jgi:hypothetical protein
MEKYDWYSELDAAVTLCDLNGTILYMNEKSFKMFEKYGGSSLVGKSLFDCHNEISVKKLKDMIANQKSNTYTIEKNGIKKIIIQKPWHDNGKYAGFVELSFELPPDMLHFNRN